MCHTVTGPPLLKVEVIFHMRIVLNATGTAMEFVKPLSNCFSIGAKSALGKPHFDHLTCELSGSEKARKLFDRQQPQWKRERMGYRGASISCSDVAWLSFVTAGVKLLQSR